MTKRRLKQRTTRSSTKLNDEEREALWARFSKKPRNVQYSEEIALQILTRMANGETITQICRDKTMPCHVTVRNWALDMPAFKEAFTRAKKLQVEHWVEECKDIADDGKNDYTEKQARNGKKFISFDSEHVQRSRLRIDVVRWLASVNDPEKYANKDLAAAGALLGGAAAKSFAEAVDKANNTSAQERRRIADGQSEKTTH